MKKNTTMQFFATLVCTSLFLLGSCSDSPEELENDICSALSGETRSGGIPDDAVYHEQTQSWIYHRNDPYTLANFRNAYDNLISNPSARSVSGTVMAELASLKLEATHYSVKIYPKTEEELRELERMSDITVCYIPFDYAQLPESQITDLSRSNASVFPEEERYTIVHEGYMTSEGPADPETITMPVLYLVWPCSKPFPVDMDYEILYEVYLPAPGNVSDNRRSAGLESNAIHLLEEKALSLAWGAQLRGLAPTWQYKRGYVYYKDNFMGEEIPIGHLKVRIQSGSKVTDLMTDNWGYYRNAQLSPSNASTSFVFETELWKITEPGKLIPISIQMFSLMGSNDHGWLGWSELPVYEIHRALTYYYFIHVLDEVININKIGGIRVVAYSSGNTSANGTFNFSKYNSPYINIYNNNRSEHNRVIGTVLHEIGHYQQYKFQGYDKFTTINNLLKESFASYVGWWEGNNYYRSLGYGDGYQRFFINDGADLTGQSRQDWEKTLTGTIKNYAPLFVDLVDNYNQNIKEERLRNYDAITNGDDLIATLAYKCTDWASYKSVLQNSNNASKFGNQEDLAKFLEPYDYFFAHQ